MRYFIVLTFLLLMAACSTDPNRDEVSAFTFGRALVVENNFDEPIYFFSVGREASAYVDWIPLVRENNRVLAGSRRNVLIDTIVLDEKDVEIIVYWWRAVENDGEMVAGELQWMLIPISD